MSKFVELMIDQIEAIEVIAGSGGCVDSLIEKIRQELTAREALLDRLADALESMFYAIADSQAGEVDKRLAVKDARAALTAYQESKP